MRGRSPKLLAVLGVAFAALVVAGGMAVILAAGGGHARPGRSQPLRATAAPASGSVGPGSPGTLAPATTVPAPSPVQQQYDQGFERGYSSPSAKAMLASADTLPLPAPVISGGWPALGISDAPEGWATSFVHALLTIDFARQSRRALGAWLVAETAPDLMPGIPAPFQDRALYVSVIDPAVMRQAPIVPTAAQWKADAKAGVRWTVSGLAAQVDPQWQAMIAAGWQPRDLRASVGDVTGVLTVTAGKTITHRHLSLVVAVGSAARHAGYGTVAVTTGGG